MFYDSFFYFYCFIHITFHFYFHCYYLLFCFYSSIQNRINISSSNNNSGGIARTRQAHGRCVQQQPMWKPDGGDWTPGMRTNIPGKTEEEEEEEHEGQGTQERVTMLLLILKWGGELTKLGERQAQELGNSFRSVLYPDMGCGGLLRLHRLFYCSCTICFA